MKLRNKKTGEIVIKHLAIKGNNEVAKTYDSLAELNAEWEDYEEPKEYWYIGDSGEVWSFSHYYLDTEIEETHREIGNLFETKEEAEKAVEKLKAWKRLKDKGISFGVKVIDRKWYLEPKAEPQPRTFDESHDLFKDIMFVFRGEE